MPTSEMQGVYFPLPLSLLYFYLEQRRIPRTNKNKKNFCICFIFTHMSWFGYSCGSAMAILECAQLREARGNWDHSAWGFGFTEQGPPRGFVFHSPGCSEGAGACRGCCSCATAANHLLNPSSANNEHGFVLISWVLWGAQQSQGLQCFRAAL